jgi:hydrogenase maturation protein HypF
VQVGTSQFTISGVVQGVGFRPFVHRLAHELGLTGEVGNDSSRVFVVVEGPLDRINEFADRVVSEAPPLARIEAVERNASSAHFEQFQIVASRGAPGERTSIPPDTAPCEDCRRELFDPDDRRHLHPFISCTNCGPRFTIITGLPYDRPSTTMRWFEMCPACAAEYEDPTDRRHHAQPIACHDCGPTLRSSRPGDPVAVAASALDRGEIVALRALGGYQLLCDARSDDAVGRLRDRKRRPEKPFAVMVSDLDAARRLADVDEAEAAALTSPARPIVLCRARADHGLTDRVAPGNPLIGVMLPSTPIHHLLLAARPDLIVCTSANLGGEPIAWRDADLDRVVRPMSDVVLDHDRPIAGPADDSVVRIVAGAISPIRRARGYAPVPVPFEGARRPVLAVGGESKNTACVASVHHAWVSQHLGDMGSLDTQEAFTRTVDGLSWMYAVDPAVVAVDAHPGYATSRWARRRHDAERIMEVQHHHAHLAALMAEHGMDPHRPLLALTFDGTGYGSDGTIWGGEALVGSADGFERVAHLARVALPGGDAAIASPYRVALAHLTAAGLPWGRDLAPVRSADETGNADLLFRQLVTGHGCVPTSSMGRLFDAVAALIGTRQRIAYEAQAAIELELLAAGAPAVDRGYRFHLDDGAPVRFDASPVIRAIVDDLHDEVPVDAIAVAFHLAVVDLVGVLAEAFADRSTDRAIGLTGGVFQNALLTEWCLGSLAERGITALVHRVVPPNDGGLSLGQAYVAAFGEVG